MMLSVIRNHMHGEKKRVKHYGMICTQFRWEGSEVNNTVKKVVDMVIKSVI